MRSIDLILNRFNMEHFTHLLSFFEKIPLSQLCSALGQVDVKDYETPIAMDFTPGSAHIIDTKSGLTFVYKCSDQLCINELSYASNLFLQSFGFPVAEMLLIKLPYSIDGDCLDYDYERSAQCTPYIDGVQNFSISRARRVSNFPQKLGRCLAFHMFIGCLSTFVFIERYIDNMIFGESLDVWDNTLINERNIGIVDDDFIILDSRIGLSLYYVDKVHSLAEEPSVVEDIVRLFAEFMGMHPEERDAMLNSYRRSYTEFSEFNDMLRKFQKWACRLDHLVLDKSF